MKRALKKKEKAELETTQSDDVPVEQINAINQRVNNRRVPTKAAMIGLAISMGATSFLVTRQSDQAIAAEPVGNQNTASTIPAASDTEVKLAPAAQPQVQTVSSVSLPESPPVVEPTAISQVAELRAKWQGVASRTSVQQVSAPVAAANFLETVEEQTISSETTKVQQLTKQEETVQISNALEQVDNQTMSVAAQPTAVPATEEVEQEVNAQLKAQQEFALNQLQAKSDRLRRSLKEFRSNETNETLPVVPVGVPQVTALETIPQQISTRKTVAEPDTASNANREKLVTRLKQRLEEAKVPAPAPAPTVADVTPSAKKSATYEVKPGDTLAEIASSYNTSVSELVKVNNLNNPNQLKINQRLAIPVAEGSTTRQTEIARSRSSELSVGSAEQTFEGTPSRSELQERPAIATNQNPIPFGNPAKSQDSVKNSIANSNSVTVPTPVIPINPNWKNRVNQTTADKLIENSNTVSVKTPVVGDNSIRKNQVAQDSANSFIANNSNVAVPTAILADNSIQKKVESTQEHKGTPATKPDTDSPAASSYGIGGDTPVPTVFAEMQESQRENSTSARKVKNQRLRGLQAEINKLREKYRAQQSGSIVASEVSETDSGSVVVPASNQNENPVQIQVPRPNNASVQFSPSRVNDGAIFIPVPKPMNSNQNRKSVRPVVRSNQRPVNEPINPELLRDQQVATPSRGMDASEVLGTMRGTTVYPQSPQSPQSPQLPPLAAVDRYLPKPIDETLAPPSASGKLMWPAKGVLTSGYGPRWGRMHRGIDIANATGTPIFAAADGVVERAGWNSGGYGYLVDIRHSDGSMTRYGHNSRILVQPGQQVQQGQQISAMGSTGFSTGPHLHFEVHPTGKGAVNPIAFLQARL
ncbi:peptidoglycan DD-metalloendopeptidase family protein [Scytonema sp. NUACC21]